MLLGVGSDAEIKTAVRKAVTGGSGPQTHLDFENKLNREYFIKEIFQSLDWADLYDKTACWDVFGWDRAERMKRVEAIVDEVMTEKKIESLNEVPVSCAVEVLKGEYPFFKNQELAALAASTDDLRSANASFWDAALQKIERKKPQGCTDPNAWAAVMNLSKEDIDHLKLVIRKGVDSRYLRHLSKEQRKIVSHIRNLYRELGQKNRDLLPDHLLKLFHACDKSNLFLFALERKIAEHRPFFEKALKDSVLKELNGKAGGLMANYEFFNTLVLKDLLDGAPNFKRRKFEIVSTGQPWPVHITNMHSLIERLRVLSAQEDPLDDNVQAAQESPEGAGRKKTGSNESFKRALQAAVLQEALDRVSGNRFGALEWQISELTKNPKTGLSLSKLPKTERCTTKIHDQGGGKVRFDHIVEAKIRDGNKTEVGSYHTRFSYSISKNGDKYSLSKLEIGPTSFEWKEGTYTPFHSIQGGDLQEIFTHQAQSEQHKNAAKMPEDAHHFFGGNGVDKSSS